MSSANSDVELERFVTIDESSEYDSETESEIVQKLVNYAVAESLPTFLKVDMQQRYPEEILIYMARMLPMDNLQVIISQCIKF